MSKPKLPEPQLRQMLTNETQSELGRPLAPAFGLALQLRRTVRAPANWDVDAPTEKLDVLYALDRASKRVKTTFDLE
jgi:hypothetical protein